MCRDRPPVSSRIVVRVADDIFENPRLAAVYDILEPDRPDLDAYLAIVD